MDAGRGRGWASVQIYAVYTHRYIFVQSRARREREQVTQQVAVFTGFPGDETRAGRCSGVPRHFHFHDGETTDITTAHPLLFVRPCRPRRAVPTPPLNGHKAPVRNLRVEALTAAAAAAAATSSLCLRCGLR